MTSEPEAVVTARLTRPASASKVAAPPVAVDVDQRPLSWYRWLESKSVRGLDVRMRPKASLVPVGRASLTNGLVKVEV